MESNEKKKNHKTKTLYKTPNRIPEDWETRIQSKIDSSQVIHVIVMLDLFRLVYGKKCPHR